MNSAIQNAGSSPRSDQSEIGYSSGCRYIKLKVELDPPDAVAQPERVVAIKLISGKPACNWWQTQYALMKGCLHMKSPREAGKQPVGHYLFA